MAQDTTLTELKINVLTQAQYNGIATKNANDLYLITDDTNGGIPRPATSDNGKILSVVSGNYALVHGLTVAAVDIPTNGNYTWTLQGTNTIYYDYSVTTNVNISFASDSASNTNNTLLIKNSGTADINVNIAAGTFCAQDTFIVKANNIAELNALKINNAIIVTGVVHKII